MSWNIKKNGKLRKAQFCSECGKGIEPLMIIGTDPEDWCWPQCDGCLEPICDKCSDLEDTGERFCIYCLTDQMIKEGRI